MFAPTQDSSRRIALLSRLLARLRAWRSEPAARRRALADPLAAFGLAEDSGAERPLAGEGARRAPPDAFPEGVTSLLLFGPQAAAGESFPPPPLEARLTAMGLRPAALLHGPEAQLAAWLRWGEERRLYGLLSAQEWRPNPDEGKGGYSNLAPKLTPARPGSGAMRSLILAPDPERAILGWMAVALGWDEVVGEVLGFPACCRAFFEAKWPQAAAEHQGDLTPLLLEATRASGDFGPYDWRLNLFARYFGAELLSHFPCSLRCAESLKMARRFESGLRRIEPETAALMESVMRGLVLYSERGGVALAPQGRLGPEGVEAPEGWLLTAPQGPLAQALRRAAGPLRPESDGRLRLPEMEEAVEAIDFSASGSDPAARGREEEAHALLQLRRA